MLNFSELSQLQLVLFLAATALVILAAGIRLTRLAQQLAVKTRLGEAIIGGALLGASTSLAGAVTSVSAASAGQTELAASNALGGIAVQTFFLAIADAAYRGANLEHAAASIENLANGALLVLLLTLVLLTLHTPELDLFGIHPTSVVLIVVWCFGLRAVGRIRSQPMWIPRRTSDTRFESAENSTPPPTPTTILALQFAALALLTAVAGYLVAAAGVETADRYHAEQSVIGALLTATITSLPELVTTVAAVRQGALQLAVGGIIGGNTFDVLFLAMSDAAFREGSIYHAMSQDVRFWAVLAAAMTAVLIFGLVRRERHGPANLGAETIAMITLYLLGLVLQAL